MGEKFAVLRLSEGQLQGCSMTDGRLKLTEPVQMGRGTLILFSMEHAVVQLGRWATKNSSLTRYQKKVGRAFEVLGLEILAKLEVESGAEKTDHVSICTRYKKRSGGKLRREEKLYKIKDAREVEV